MLRETLLTRQFNNAASEAEYELFISSGGRGRGRVTGGRMDYYRSRGKAEQ